jgi:hypothetical protein
MTKYLKTQKQISYAVRNGISGLVDSNDERTIVKTPSGGVYAFPTREFNSLGSRYLPNERTIFSLTGIGNALDLSQPEKPNRLFYPEF